MLRIVFFLALIAAVALGATWIAEQGGGIALSWGVWRVETSLPVFILVFVIALAVAMLAWTILRGIWRTPARLSQFRQRRREGRGRDAITSGLIAVGTGDYFAARRHAGVARRLAHHDPLTLLLNAQTAQLDGDRQGAQRAFRAMAERDDTRLLGLRGLFIEAQRNDDPYTAVAMAEEALKIAPASPWASQAVLGFRCAKGDWDGALAILENNFAAGLIDPEPYRRQRGVLLTARALETEQSDRELSRTSVMEAVKLAPTLEPAAALAARFLSEDNQIRRAMRIIEAAWVAQPHPDLADAYAHVRLGDAARERLARIETLAKKAPDHLESGLALARAAIDASEFSRAREALAPFVAAPTQRVALLMAELERAEHGDDGRARSWMLRAVRAAHDPAWTADGYVSDRWRPVSPVTGRLDAFQWVTPVAALPSDTHRSIENAIDDMAADEALPPPPAALPEPEPAAVAVAPEVVTSPPIELASEPVPAAQDDEVRPDVEEPEDTPSQVSAAPAAPAPKPSAVSETVPPPIFRSRPANEQAAAAPPVIPLVRAPDDPGVADVAAENGFDDPDRRQAGQPGGWRGFLARLVG
ncbi:MAG: heme biosynthesis protein HemY [Rhizobiales bacterium]|nr:heme biosynthesis protein HemY [Hyphomicrobiales bacterium]